MRLHLPGRATVLDQLKPGACFLVPDGAGVAVGLAVCDRGRHGALILDRRDGARGLEPALVAEERLRPDVFEVTEAVLAPVLAPAPAPVGFGGARPVPWALYLGDGCAFLRARDADGAWRAYEVVSGRASAVALDDLPWAGRWRITVPDADGSARVLFEAGPDAPPARGPAGPAEPGHP